MNSNKSKTIPNATYSIAEILKDYTPGMLRKLGIFPTNGEPCNSVYVRAENGKCTAGTEYEYTIGRDC